MMNAMSHIASTAIVIAGWWAIIDRLVNYDYGGVFVFSAFMLPLTWAWWRHYFRPDSPCPF